jgi:metallo-beta-lactamase family protein
MRISFLGAAQEVTGSCFLVEGAGVRFLVDCGMFQGGREAYRRNLSAFQFGFPAKALDFVILTHAHIDHSGLLPRLGAMGFRGPVYATPATCALAEVLLLDSAHIQEKEAEWENRHRHAQHAQRDREEAPLYTVNQARECLRRLRPCPYDTEGRPHETVRFIFRDAGHILGSAIVELWLTEAGRTRKLVFSGDLGQPQRPVLRDPTPILDADILIVESTYGNRQHKCLADTEDELVEAFIDTLQRKRGNLIMPAFAVGRTQEVLFILTDLVRRNRLPAMTIYVDSPMAESATALTLRYQDLLDTETRELIAWQRQHPDRPAIRFVQEVEESMALNEIKSGAVIISASGMCDAGRVKHHLRHNISRQECSVVITGFQAAGTLGRRLVDGARWVRIFGEELPVRADIYTIGGLSAHADREALLRWLGHFERPPEQCFVVHGEAETAQMFANAVRDLGWPEVAAPAHGEVHALDGESRQ